MASGFRRKRRARAREVTVKIKLPFIGEFGGVWEPQRAESEAAWELYVELVTRVAVVELGPGEGLAREALSSLYSLFGSTRDILRKYGPAVASRSTRSEITFGTLAVAVLNGTLRPLLTRWHPRLRSWESQCPEGKDPVAHENEWEHIDALRAHLDEARASLAQLADVLAEVAGATPLTDTRHAAIDENPKKERGGVALPAARYRHREVSRSVAGERLGNGAVLLGEVVTRRRRGCARIAGSGLGVSNKFCGDARDWRPVKSTSVG